MNSVPENGEKRTAPRRDGAKHLINVDRIMAREMNAFYRESDPALSSDSADSSRKNSISNDSDYQTSVENVPGDRCGLKNSRDEIAEKLSKLKIGYNKNLKGDSGTVEDLTSEDDLKSHSIIAGNSPADIHCQTIPSITDSRCSIILAGRLNSKDDLYALTDERSLLNIAINESLETNYENQSNNAELSRFVDSLEVQRKEVSSSGLNERDSLEAGASRAVDKPENLKKQNPLFVNDENSDPNSLESKKWGQPRIISNITLYSPIKILKKTAKTFLVAADGKKPEFFEPALEYQDKGNSDSSDRTESRFNSFPTDSEKLIFADIKTPNIKQILIEDCRKSSPKIEVNADTFGSEMMSDILNLSTLGNTNFDRNGESVEPECSRDKILKKFSQKFAEAPTKFTEKLLTLVEQSFLAPSKPEDSDISGVNLSRLTEEFRKICRTYCKEIKDESVPDFGFGPSFNVSTPPGLDETKNATWDKTSASPFQNFSKLGGGTKVYRKTPRRVFQGNNGSQCSTPNCANALHKARNNNLYSPGNRGSDGINDNTETFEFWENLCYEMSPTKHTRSKLSSIESFEVPTQEDWIRKSDQQMASLDQSSVIEFENEKENKFRSDERNSTKNPKDFQDHVNSMRNKFIKNSSPCSGKGNDNDKSNKNVRDSNNKQNYNETKQNLASIVEKRKKCFEAARRVFESNQSTPVDRDCKSLDKASQFMEKNEYLGHLNHQARFVNTLSACADYFEYFATNQNHRNPLQCILECSENSELMKIDTTYSRSTEHVEAVIIPRHNRANYKIQSTEFLRPESSPKQHANLIARTCLYIPGSPKIPEENKKSLPKSPKKTSHFSPCRLSPKGQSPNVVSKKIKSPVSPARRKSLRAAKPASHACVPKTPSITPDFHVLGNKQSGVSCKSGINSAPRCPSHSNLKSATNSPSLMDVTNTKKRNEIPKLTLTKSSPSFDSQKKSTRSKIFDENIDLNCQKELQYSGLNTPEVKKRKFFYTPGKTPNYGRVKPKIKYFETPKAKLPVQKKLSGNSPAQRVNYNTVQSPVGMYIRGTDSNLITNVKGKTNDKMLTPRATTPKSRSKVASPILARSPCMSPQSTESSRLKFQLTPAKRQQQKQEDVLNMALCESDPSSNIGSETTSHSPFPKIFYKPAPCVKMVKDNQAHRHCPNVLARGMEQKIIYRHEGRLKSATESRAANFPSGGSSKDSMSCDSGDISLLHQRPAVKSNYLLKK